MTAGITATRTRTQQAGAAALALAGLQACAEIKPWERGDLARSEMAWDPDPVAATMDAHMYFAKEASSGGCGCN